MSHINLNKMMHIIGTKKLQRKTNNPLIIYLNYSLVVKLFSSNINIATFLTLT